MRGSMRQRGGAWEVRVYVGADPVTGRKRYATKTVRGGKRVAQRELAVMVAAADKGALARTSATVADLLEAWLDQATGEFSPKTVLETRAVLDRYWAASTRVGGAIASTAVSHARRSGLHRPSAVRTFRNTLRFQTVCCRAARPSVVVEATLLVEVHHPLDLVERGVQGGMVDECAGVGR